MSSFSVSYSKSIKGPFLIPTGLSLSGKKKKSKLLYQLSWGKKHKRFYPKHFPEPGTRYLVYWKFIVLILNLTQPLPFPQGNQVHTLLACLTWGFCPGIHFSCFISITGAEITKASQAFMYYCP